MSIIIESLLFIPAFLMRIEYLAIVSKYLILLLAPEAQLSIDVKKKHSVLCLTTTFYLKNNQILFATLNSIQSKSFCWHCLYPLGEQYFVFCCQVMFPSKTVTNACFVLLQFACFLLPLSGFFLLFLNFTTVVCFICRHCILCDTIVVWFLLLLFSFWFFML